MLTAVFCLTGAGPLDKGLSGALSVVVFLVLKDFLIRQLPNAPKRYVMCPVVDFCNHSSGVASDLAYEYFLNRRVPSSAVMRGNTFARFIPARSALGHLLGGVYLRKGFSELTARSFTLTTSATKKGEQLYISYGPQPNDDLLQFYGCAAPGRFPEPAKRVAASRTAVRFLRGKGRRESPLRALAASERGWAVLMCACCGGAGSWSGRTGTTGLLWT